MILKFIYQLVYLYDAMIILLLYIRTGVIMKFQMNMGKMIGLLFTRGKNNVGFDILKQIAGILINTSLRFLKNMIPSFVQ